MIFHAAATERYVWRSNKRLVNGSAPGLNGDDGDQASLRMSLGRKMDEVTRCALYAFRQPLKIPNVSLVGR
jgi:hypothetical protein